MITCSARRIDAEPITRQEDEVIGSYELPGGRCHVYSAIRLQKLLSATVIEKLHLLPTSKENTTVDTLYHFQMIERDKRHISQRAVRSGSECAEKGWGRLEIEAAEFPAGGKGKRADAAVRERIERISDIGAAQDGKVGAGAFCTLLLFRIIAQCVHEADLIALEGEDAIEIIKIGVRGFSGFLLADRQGNCVLFRQEEDALVARGSIGESAFWHDQAVGFLRLGRIAHVKQGELYAARASL